MDVTFVFFLLNLCLNYSDPFNVYIFPRVQHVMLFVLTHFSVQFLTV